MGLYSKIEGTVTWKAELYLDIASYFLGDSLFSISKFNLVTMEMFVYVHVASCHYKIL